MDRMGGRSARQSTSELIEHPHPQANMHVFRQVERDRERQTDRLERKYRRLERKYRRLERKYR